MDEKGYSWPEAMLTLAIIMVIFGSLLPLATTMTSTVTAKKQAMIAAETTYQAAVHFKSAGKTIGRRTHEEMHYDWTVSDSQICVAYEVFGIKKDKCVSV